MPTLSDVVDALAASRPFDGASLPRLAYRVGSLGDKEIADITPDEVDEAVARLVSGGRLTQLPGARNVPAGKSLANSTVNRYISQLGGVFRYARIEQKAAGEYTIPGSTRTRVAGETIRDWLNAYRRGGFDALLPKPRADPGLSFW